MLSLRRATLPLLSGLVFALACEAPTNAPVISSINYCIRAESLRAAFSPQPTIWTAPYEMALASQLVPGGFGGYYRDPAEGRLAIVLHDTTRIETARTALAQMASCGSLFAGEVRDTELREASVRHGSYDAIQLLGYYRLAGETAILLDSCWGSLGINWSRNVVEVGVGSPSLVDSAYVSLIAAGIPYDALWVHTICVGSAKLGAAENPIRRTAQ